MPAPARTSGGYRDYDPEDVDRVRYLRRGQELGFTLGALGTMLGLSRSSEPLSREVSSLGRAKVEEIEARITDLVRVRDALTALLDAQCPDPNVPCPIVEALARPA